MLSPDNVDDLGAAVTIKSRTCCGLTNGTLAKSKFLYSSASSTLVRMSEDQSRDRPTFTSARSLDILYSLGQSSLSIGTNTMRFCKTLNRFGNACTEEQRAKFG